MLVHMLCRNLHIKRYEALKYIQLFCTRARFLPTMGLEFFMSYEKFSWIDDKNIYLLYMYVCIWMYYELKVMYVSGEKCSVPRVYNYNCICWILIQPVTLIKYDIMNYTWKFMFAFETWDMTKIMPIINFPLYHNFEPFFKKKYCFIFCC